VLTGQGRDVHQQQYIGYCVLGPNVTSAVEPITSSHGTLLHDLPNKSSVLYQYVQQINLKIHLATSN